MTLDMSTAANSPAQAAATQYLTIAGDRIGYRRIGTGSPLLLANRMRGTLDTWDPLLLDTLAQRHTVITFDYPGTGYSAGTLPGEMSEVTAFITALADKLGIGTFAIAGWSWGGAVAQTMVIDYPHLVSHAVLMGTNPPGEVEHPISQLFLDRAFKPVNTLADEEVLFFEPGSERSRAAAARSHQRIYARADVASKIPSTTEEIMAFIAAFQIFTEDATGRRDKLTRSEVSILILGGDNDISTATQNWFPLIGKFPRAQLIVLPEAGHGPHHQYPTLAAQYITTFIANPEL